MKRVKKSSLNFTTTLEYCLIFVLFLIFNKLEKTIYPYSVAIFVSAIGLGTPIIISSFLFLASFFVLGKIGLLASACIVVFFYCILSLIYKRSKIKVGFLFSALTIIAMLGFVFIGDTNVFIPIEKRLSVCFFATLLSFLALNSGLAISKKGLKYKLGYDEYVSIILITIAIGLGICNLTSPYIWKGTR